MDAVTTTNENDLVRFTNAMTGAINGLSGDDRFILTEAFVGTGGIVHLDGGSGRDVLDLSRVMIGRSSYESRATVEIRDVSGSPGIAEVVSRGSSTILTFADIEVIRISPQWDYGFFDLRNIGHSVTLFGGNSGNSFAANATLADRFIGGFGSDDFEVRVGDVAYGRGGNDHFDVIAGERFDIFGGDSSDMLFVRGASVIDLAAGRMINGGVTNIVASIESVSMSVEDGYRGEVLGTADNNSMFHSVKEGFGGTVIFHGRGGNDTLLGNGHLHGGSGNDVVSGSGTLIGGTGNDRITGIGDGSRIVAGAGDDRIDALGDHLVITTGAGADRIFIDDAVGVPDGLAITMDADDIINLAAIDADGRSARGNGIFDLVLDADLFPATGSSGHAGTLTVAGSVADGWTVQGFIDDDAVADFTMTVRAPEGWWIDGLVL